jgi:hypothetical protein
MIVSPGHRIHAITTSDKPTQHVTQTNNYDKKLLLAMEGYL